MSPSRVETTADGSLSRSAALFAALGDDTRLWLVARLSRGGPLSIAQLSTGSGMTRQAITKHLHVLAEVGWVTDHRKGRETLWEFQPDQLKCAQQFLDKISEQWDSALGRLTMFVEGPE